MSLSNIPSSSTKSTKFLAKITKNSCSTQDQNLNQGQILRLEKMKMMEVSLIIVIR